MSDLATVKALLITRYFPPSGSVAAFRTGSLAQYAADNGISLQVLTAQHTGTTPSSLRGMEVHSVPFADANRPATQYPRIDQLKHTVRRLADLPEDDVIERFMEAALRLIREENPEVLVVSSGPITLVELAWHLYRKTGIPYVCDFRDLWSNSELKENDPGILTKLSNQVYRAKVGKWLSNAALITTVNEDLLEVLKDVSPPTTGIVVTNGFDEKEMEEAVDSFQEFTVSCIGTIYPEQNVALMVRGLRTFSEQHPDVRFRFPGGNSFPNVAKAIRDGLRKECLSISDRIPHTEAIRVMKASHVLIYPAWQGYRGITTGKIFEYAASGKHVVLAPSDHAALARVVRNLRLGKEADTSDALVSILNGYYEEWKSGTLHDRPLTNEVLTYSRRAQATTFWNAVKSVIQQMGGRP